MASVEESTEVVSSTLTLKILLITRKTLNGRFQVVNYWRDCAIAIKQKQYSIFIYER